MRHSVFLLSFLYWLNLSAYGQPNIIFLLSDDQGDTPHSALILGDYKLLHF